MKHKITLLIIGRNEASNLTRCFNSIDKTKFSEVIFVDSSSIDNSIQIAKNSKKVALAQYLPVFDFLEVDH